MAELQFGMILLAIRLGIIIQNKMGYHGGLYHLLAKIAGLPCDRTLSQYKVPNSNDPDGFMYGTVMNEKINLTDCSKMPNVRHGRDTSL